MDDSGGRQITQEERSQVDGASLAAAIGIDGEEIAWRKGFTGFDAADERRLEALYPAFEETADGLVEEFYEHLQAHSETLAVLDRSDKPVEALKRSQREYLKDIARGEYGQDYFDRRARIGKLHDMLGLGPKLYLGAYTVYYEGLLGTIAEEVKSEFAEEAWTDGGEPSEQRGTSSDFRSDGGVDEVPAATGTGPTGATAVASAVDATVERMLSVLRLMNLDQQVAMDTYIESYAEQMETEMERRKELTTEVEEDVRAPIEELKNAAEGVARSAQQISGVADEQAESMDTVAGELSTVSATIEEIAATADEVNQRSTEAAARAEEGREAADSALAVMGDVEAAAAEVSEDFDSLQERIGEVDEVVEVINRIAEQTNLLALNASIEAARAGDAGQGFAVVADEVKSLAEESQQQAGQIEDLVADIRADAAETVESLDEAGEQVERGSERVEDAMESLGSIAEAAEETSRGITEVAEATDEQSASTEAVAALVENAVEGAETVSTEVEDIAAATEEQTAMLDEVTSVVTRLADD